MQTFFENSWGTNLWRIRQNFVDFLSQEKLDEEEFFANALLVNKTINFLYNSYILLINLITFFSNKF